MTDIESAATEAQACVNRAMTLSLSGDSAGAGDEMLRFPTPEDLLAVQMGYLMAFVEWLAAVTSRTPTKVWADFLLASAGGSP